MYFIRHFLIVLLVLVLAAFNITAAQQVLIPMDASQTNHLKAYGVIFNHINDGYAAKWLLNYNDGSFLAPKTNDIIKKSRLRNVKIKVISESEANNIIQTVEQPDANTAVVPLVKAPKIAVYTPRQNLPWDDAVTLALTYAEVPYDKVWDPEVLNGKLTEYDWLHMHHEDFTGQYGKFWVSYRNHPWYIKQVKEMEAMAKELGYNKVTKEKRAVALEIKNYVKQGGFLFSMCSGTDTFDIALSSIGVDIAPTPFDSDPVDPNTQENLDFDNTLAFENFEVVTDATEYEHANIDVPVNPNQLPEELDFFTLFDFSAKWDPVPTMLTQNHVSSVKGFYGQTTAYQADKVKESVVVLGKNPGRNHVKYLHGNYGRGTFTFYAGHDPEDYMHRVDDPPTDLSLHTNSPGYRLILNNILFPAAKKKKRKT